MNKSIVLQLTGKAGQFITIFKYKFILSLNNLPTFMNNNPTIKVFNESTQAPVGIYEEVRFEICCFDQAQFDLYLLEPTNFKTTFELILSEPDVITWCTANNTTASISVIENSTTTRGSMTSEQLLQHII